MTKDDIRAHFANLRPFEGKDGQRALNRPIMLLWAIGQCFARSDRLIPYREVVSGYSPLMRRFGPYRASTHPEYPFWYLRNSKIWEVENADCVAEDLTASGDAKPTRLDSCKARAGFIEPVHQAFLDDPNFAGEIAEILVATYFGNTSLSGDIFESIGFGTPKLLRERVEVYRRYRDPRFRILVLEAYKDKCAVCKSSLQMGGKLVGIEAAHVRWHSRQGVDDISNGIAMCSLHHFLFDYGVFTLSPSYQIIVAETLRGNALHEWIGRFESEQIFMPEEPPHHKNLLWHHRNVFKANPKTAQAS